MCCRRRADSAGELKMIALSYQRSHFMLLAATLSNAQAMPQQWTQSNALVYTRLTSCRAVGSIRFEWKNCRNISVLPSTTNYMAAPAHTHTQDLHHLPFTHSNQSLHVLGYQRLNLRQVQTTTQNSAQSKPIVKTWEKNTLRTQQRVNGKESEWARGKEGESERQKLMHKREKQR